MLQRPAGVYNMNFISSAKTFFEEAREKRRSMVDFHPGAKHWVRRVRSTVETM
jgi:hypothetical protein